VVGHSVGTFLQRARSGRGGSARASAGDRAVAAQGGLASLRVALFAAKGNSGRIWSGGCSVGSSVTRDLKRYFKLPDDIPLFFI
jgi:hypothetical protein